MGDMVDGICSPDFDSSCLAAGVINSIDFRPKAVEIPAEKTGDIPVKKVSNHREGSIDLIHATNSNDRVDYYIENLTTSSRIPTYKLTLFFDTDVEHELYGDGMLEITLSSQCAINSMLGYKVDGTEWRFCRPDEALFVAQIILLRILNDPCNFHNKENIFRAAKLMVSRPSMKNLTRRKSEDRYVGDETPRTASCTMPKMSQRSAVKLTEFEAAYNRHKTAKVFGTECLEPRNQTQYELARNRAMQSRLQSSKSN